MAGLPATGWLGLDGPREDTLYKGATDCDTDCAESRSRSLSTIREVAGRAGVSPTTVSHVLNQTRFVSELGYRPNALARSLRRGETQTIGLILPDSANPYFAELGRAIESAAFRLGYSPD